MRPVRVSDQRSVFRSSRAASDAHGNVLRDSLPDVSLKQPGTTGNSRNAEQWWGRQNMKPTHPVELLCCAISTQEGYFGGRGTPVLRNNPGDLRAAGQIGASAPGWTGQGGAPIATFDPVAHGIPALFRQVWVQVAEGQKGREIIAQWAPPNENNTSLYLENVLRWTGLPADTPVLELLPALVQLNLPPAVS